MPTEAKRPALDPRPQTLDPDLPAEPHPASRLYITPIVSAVAVTV